MLQHDAPAFAGLVRLRLNAIRIASGAAASLAIASTVSGIAALAAQVFGIDTGGLPIPLLWAASTLFTSLLGALVAARKLLSVEEAAAWLDSRLATKELLSAALLRAGQGGEGRFDDEIATRLEALAPRVRHPGFPLAGLARRGFAALASLVAFGSLIAWAELPPFLAAGNAPIVADDQALTLERRALAEGRLSKSSAEALGSWLFPEDPRLAAEASRDLEEGKLGDLKALLRDAERASAGQSADPGAVERARRLGEASRRMGSAGEAGGSGEGGAGSADSADRNRPGAAGSGQGSLQDGNQGSTTQPEQKPGGSPTEPGDARKGEGGKRGTPAPGQAPPSPPRSQAPDRSPDSGTNGGGPTPPPPEGSPGGVEPSPGASDEGSSGGDFSRPRAGSGSARSRNWGALSPEATGGPLVIPADPSKPWFQSVLPGSREPTAAAARIGEAARSAEAATAGSDLPADYEQLIRNYFLSLAEEANSAPIPGAASQGGVP